MLRLVSSFFKACLCNLPPYSFIFSFFKLFILYAVTHLSKPLDFPYLQFTVVPVLTLTSSLTLFQGEEAEGNPGGGTAVG